MWGWWASVFSSFLRQCAGEIAEGVCPSVLISSGGTLYLIAIRKCNQLMGLDILASLKKLIYKMKDPLDCDCTIWSVSYPSKKVLSKFGFGFCMYACLEHIERRYRCTYSYVCCSCHEDMSRRKKEVTCRQHQCRAAVCSLPGWTIPGQKMCVKNVCFSMWKYRHKLCGQNSEDSSTSAWHQGAIRNGTPTVAGVGWPVEGAVKEEDEVCVRKLFRSWILTESELVAKSVSSPCWYMVKTTWSLCKWFWNF